MKSYTLNGITNSGLHVNNSNEGETIEEQVERMVNNNEPIEGEAPLTYTERKDGVLPEYDIRTDRFEIAIDATDKIQASYSARREERLKPKENDKVEPTQGTPETK